MDRLNTKVMLKRRNLFDEDDDVSCVLCSSGAKVDLEHLFFSVNSPKVVGRK